MKLWPVLLLCVLTNCAVAQQKEVTGIVFDKNTKARVAKVHVVNLNSGSAVFNNLQGEFKITAGMGDVLIFTKPDHFNDTVKITDNKALAVYIKPTAIQLKEVTIRDSSQTPDKRLGATKNEYNKIYGSLGYRDVLNVSPMGAGISIDALYNIFSKSGRNAEHLKEIIDRDYRENVIDYRFNKTYVKAITGLTEPRLTDFMLKYRPGYTMVTTATDYDFIAYIRTSLRRFKRNPRAYELSPLLPGAR